MLAHNGDHAYPLLIKRLLMTPLLHAPDQEIVYRKLKRYSYRILLSVSDGWPTRSRV